MSETVVLVISSFSFFDIFSQLSNFIFFSFCILTVI